MDALTGALAGSNGHLGLLAAVRLLLLQLARYSYTSADDAMSAAAIAR